ncbi:MAG: ADP-glyceromanno-heptose 6-epimerase [Chlorobi bacterium]|nr:ADP-glyceromanno-heptose 6-epimerase [Chlorobiota bacterium]
MIIITGGAGFIGSTWLTHLNRMGIYDILLVDNLSERKKRNIEGKKYYKLIPREELFRWLKANAKSVSAIFHFGARTDTTEHNWDVLRRLNLEYSKQLALFCIKEKIPFIYASSAATYGDGSLGYKDDEKLLFKLRPLNPYGWSKQLFDEWLLSQPEKPPRWYGLKFFNVYGPNEYHKGRMASVLWHAWNQYKREGKVKLFMSHRPDYAHGEQKRDFIYIMDAHRMIEHLWLHKAPSGIYNIATGKARSFNDLITAMFKAIDKEPVIEYIPMPEDLRNQYQYFTEGDISKLRKSGYLEPTPPLEVSVADYVLNYLQKKSYY